jgi:uncharacterized protein (DUF2062 family)
LSDAAPALVAGLFIIGGVAGLLGYIVARWIWRWRVGLRWRRRLHRHQVETSAVVS